MPLLGEHFTRRPIRHVQAQGLAIEEHERWIASARRECLDRILITGERHLRLVLSEYLDHYNTCRPHRTLHQKPPAGPTHTPVPGADVRVLRRDRLGGLIHEYAQVA